MHLLVFRIAFLNYLTYFTDSKYTKRMFIAESEISNGDLRDICNKSLRREDFDHNSYVPIIKLGDVFLSELFYGPTQCFKDFG